MATKSNDINHFFSTFDDQTRKRFLQIRTATYQKILSDRTTALLYAKKALQQIQPEKLDAEHVEEYTDLMQSVARLIIDQRKKLER